MHNGWRIINIDESVLRQTDSRLRGWMSSKKKNMVTSNSRLVWVNLIAALTSDGEVLYTVNIGKTNSYTFGFFLTKLTSYLDAQDAHWRKSTVPRRWPTAGWFSL